MKNERIKMMAAIIIGDILHVYGDNDLAVDRAIEIAAKLDRKVDEAYPIPER